MKSKCDTCMHAEVCMHRDGFEALLEDENVMAELNNINNKIDWIDVTLECKHYGFNLMGFKIGNTTSNEPEPEPEEKKSAVDIFKNMLFGGSKDD